MDRICGVILYNPGKEDISNIRYWCSCFDVVFLYQNSLLTPKCLEELKNESNIFLLGSGHNDGLSVACDVICEEAKMKGYQSVILFDQDSRIAKQSIDLLFDYAHDNFNNRVGIVCPIIDYGKGKGRNKQPEERISWCITSGSLINLTIYGTHVSFDKNYFIDRLDKDFCQQTLNAGYSIIRLGNAVLNQQLGETLSSFWIKYSSHSVVRHYYIARNRLYYNHKYDVSFLVSIAQTIRHLYEILMWEDYKMRKIFSLFNGINDYFHNRFGGKI